MKNKTLAIHRESKGGPWRERDCATTSYYGPWDWQQVGEKVIAEVCLWWRGPSLERMYDRLRHAERAQKWWFICHTLFLCVCLCVLQTEHCNKVPCHTDGLLPVISACGASKTTRLMQWTTVVICNIIHSPDVSTALPLVESHSWWHEMVQNDSKQRTYSYLLSSAQCSFVYS